MNKRQAKRKLKMILGQYNEHNAPAHNVQVLKRAVYFAKEHGLKLPSNVAGILIIKVFELMWEREQMNVKKNVSEKRLRFNFGYDKDTS